jgi:hypothetical protein
MSTTNGRVPTQQVEGTVEATNRTGIRIGGAWLNVSQFHPIELPEQGAHVRLEVDAKGYIKDLEVLSEHTPVTASVSRNETITRLAVLKAAAEFGASRPDLRSGDVLKIADSWLAWVEGD